jgi:hypothetical protein
MWVRKLDTVGIPLQPVSDGVRECSGMGNRWPCQLTDVVPNAMPIMRPLERMTYQQGFNGRLVGKIDLRTPQPARYTSCPQKPLTRVDKRARMTCMPS